MKKNTILGLSVCATILFTGCGSTMSCVVAPKYNNTQDSKVLYVSGKESWRSPSAGHNLATRNKHLLQNAAQETLERGYKYFAFIAPNGEANNRNGSLMHTAEEFLKKCIPSAANPFTIGQGSMCGWGHQGASAGAQIAMFNEQQATMTTYIAQDVKDYMIANKHWREDGVESKKESCQNEKLKY